MISVHLIIVHRVPDIQYILFVSNFFQQKPMKRNDKKEVTTQQQQCANRTEIVAIYVPHITRQWNFLQNSKKKKKKIAIKFIGNAIAIDIDVNVMWKNHDKYWKNKEKQ